MKPTRATEETRTQARAAELGLELDPSTPFAPDTPELVIPAARLYLALTGKLASYGVNATPVLADARHSAILAALERSTRALTALAAGATDLELLDLAHVNAADVELDALRRAEDALVELLAEVEAATTRQRLEVDRDSVAKILRTAAANANGHGGKR